MTMPKNKKKLEQMLLIAFQEGMNAGYGIEHTDIINEERKANKRFMESRNFKYSYDELRREADK